MKEEELKLEEKTAAPLWEEVEKRGSNRKVYTRDGVEKEAVFYANAVHAAADEQICQEDGKYYRFGNGGLHARFNRSSGELFRVEKDSCCLTVSALERGRRRTDMSVPRLVQENNDKYLVYEQVSHGTDYRYTADSSRVKEDIVIREKATDYRYGFLLESSGLEMSCQEEERRLIFRSLESGEEVFMIPAPFMMDAAGVYSDKVNYEVRTVDANKTVLTIIADSDWINAQERVFPITVDPQIMLAGSSGMSTYQWSGGSMSAAGAVISVGSVHSGNYCFDKRMYMKLSMPTLPKNARIKKATLDLCQRERVGSNLRLCLYQVTGEINTGSCTPAIKESMLDYVMTTVSGNANHSFDITTAFDSMLQGETPYANLMLRAEQEGLTKSCYADIFGTSAAMAPKLTVTYENGYDANRAASTSHDLGVFGKASLELQSGILSVESEDMAWQGNRMPVSIRHMFTNALSGQQYTQNADIDLYTADFHAMHIGYGWKLNYMQSMMPKLFMHDGTQRSGYVYTDEVGAQIYLLESTQEYFKKKYVTDAGTTEEYYLYEDLNDLGYLYDPHKRELYHCADTYSFDAAGRLTEIRDQNDNTVKIVYTGGKLTSIVDGAGRAFELNYNSGGMLTSITAPDASVVSYTYTGENLTGITARDGSHTVLGYINNLLSSATLYQSKESTAYEYRVEYAYDSANRVRQIKELGMGGVSGQSASYTYNIAARTTTVQNTIDEGEETLPITTVYTFDRDGVVLGSYAYTNRKEKMQVTPMDTGINPYVNGVNYSSGTGNLLTNHNFQTLTGWNKVSGECGDLLAGAYTAMPAHALYGSSMLRMIERKSNAGRDGVYQLTNVLESGEYTFSAYIRLLADVERAQETGGVFLRVTDTAGNVLAEGERLLKKNEDYVRLALPFTLKTAQSVKVWICVEGKTELYADAAQLEKSPFASPYNLLQNGNFFQGKENWDVSSYGAINSNDSFNGKNSLVLQGSPTAVRYASQSVNVRTFTDVRETFTLSGWGKAAALPAKGGKTTDPQFCLCAKILYTDNTSEEYIADFSDSTDEWQPATVTFSKAAYKAVSKLTVYCRYNFESGYALFDDIQLVQDGCETGLTAEDFVTDTSQPDPSPGESGTEPPEETPVFEEVYDYYGNPITDTQFTEGEYGTIYRSMEYNADNPATLANDAGNDLIAETDPRGYKTQYEVRESSSKVVISTDRCGISTQYGYDDAGRLSIMFVLEPDPGISTLSGISYDYNSMGKVNSIGRDDGMIYTLDYNRFHQLTSVSMTGMGNLVNLTYKGNNGRLEGITYPRDGQVSYVYNRFGQVVTEIWKKNNVVTDKYKFTYDNTGRVVQCVDIFGKIEYNYVYYKDNAIYSISTNSIQLNENEVIISKIPLNTIYYRYSKGDLIGKKIVTENGTEQSYTYSTEGKPKITLPTGAVCQTNTDHLGRKTFDEIELGTGLLSRNFTYHAGKITEDHQAYEKVKSVPTTKLVDKITYANGRTIRYQYDPEERITKVTDSVDGVTEYTYDILGQLICEKRNGVATDITYDECGNILTKGGKTYAYGETNVDLLTSYDGAEISYGTGINKGLNPIVYRGMNLTWTKGRQLAAVSSNGKTITFSYNPKGIRTSKTVNGAKHDYVLEGTKLIRDVHNGVDYVYDAED